MFTIKAMISFLLLFGGSSTRVFPQESMNCQPIRKRLLLGKGWKFFIGDIPLPVVKGHQASYDNAKAVNALGAAKPRF